MQQDISKTSKLEYRKFTSRTSLQRIDRIYLENRRNLLKPVQTRFGSTKAIYNRSRR